MTWNWYAWPSLDAFTAWHADAMADQGIPHYEDK